ncbi:hypothetical protein PENTCL1PPCAC_10251, partial [Pristionchus entomophagus]
LLSSSGMVASSTTCPPNAAMEGISTATKVRPTQSYYVPPRPVSDGDQEKDRASPKDQKKNVCAQLYTPPHSRNQSQMPSTPKLRPLMDIQLEKTSLFAESSTSSESSRKSPDVAKKSPDIENRTRKDRKASAEQRQELFPKIISVPSSSSNASDARKSAPPREGFSSNVLPPPRQPKASDGCICDREKTHVACKRCGYECSGRLALVCPLHPMQMNLMDLTACPNPLCHSVQLYEVALH